MILAIDHALAGASTIFVTRISEPRILYWRLIAIPLHFLCASFSWT